MWRKVTVIPEVVGALGAIITGCEKFVEEIGIGMRIEHPQKTTLLGTARILWLVLEWSKPFQHKSKY